MRIIQLLRFVWFRDDKGSTSTLITAQRYRITAIMRLAFLCIQVVFFSMKTK